jgi:hypothetical protein
MALLTVSYWLKAVVDDRLLSANSGLWTYFTSTIPNLQ